MESIYLLQGDGQEIYIDIDSLYISPKWFDPDRHAIIMPDRESSKSNPVYETYRGIFNYFYKMGYRIITDSKEVSNDTFFFSPCLDKHVNTTQEEYEGKKRIKLYLIFQPLGFSNRLL